ncbi:MAG: DedA family protein [Gammaproteobacteria bacterium]|nr:DedA family protein [Gammaproteobacteria bacterium]
MTPEIEHLLTVYGYWLMAFGALIEGETFLIAGGIAAHKGYFHLYGLIALALFGSTIHDCFFFFLGRFWGDRFIKKKPQLYEKAERVLDLFEKYGVWLIIGLRFAYGLRTLIPTVFGISHIGTGKFIFFDIIGGILWSCTFILGGYFFGAVLDRLMTDFDRYSAYFFYGILVAAIVAAFGGLIYWRYRVHQKKSV